MSIDMERYGMALAPSTWIYLVQDSANPFSRLALPDTSDGRFLKLGGNERSQLN